MRERGATNPHGETEEGETNGRRTPHTYRREKEDEATVLREREKEEIKKLLLVQLFFTPHGGSVWLKKVMGSFLLLKKVQCRSVLSHPVSSHFDKNEAVATVTSKWKLHSKENCREKREKVAVLSKFPFRPKSKEQTFSVVYELFFLLTGMNGSWTWLPRAWSHATTLLLLVFIMTGSWNEEESSHNCPGQQRFKASIVISQFPSCFPSQRILFCQRFPVRKKWR